MPQGTTQPRVAPASRRDSFEVFRRILESPNQSHLLAFGGELDELQRRQLLDDLDRIDFSELPSLARLAATDDAGQPDSGPIEPPTVIDRRTTPDDVTFVQQSVMPAFDRDGRIILDQNHRVGLSPDGHGGTLLALARRVMLADMDSEPGRVAIGAGACRPGPARHEPALTLGTSRLRCHGAVTTE